MDSVPALGHDGLFDELTALLCALLKVDVALVAQLDAADPSQLVRPNGCRDFLHRQVNDSLMGLPRKDFDFVWMIDAPPYDEKLVADLPVAWRGPNSVLYRLH